MPSLETRMGGPEEAFPETVWSSILASRDASSPERKSGLNHLFELYWRPVYKFIRVSGGRSVEDAKDLSQEFFCHLLEGNLLQRYQPDLGRFRNFLKGALRNFLAEAYRDGKRLKRGGQMIGFSIDVKDVENERFQADAQKYSPEELFDRQWARDVMAQALVALRKSLAKEGKEAYFRVYELYDLHAGKAARPTYDQVAKEAGVSASDVTNYLHLARERLQQIISGRVAEYVTSKDELARELAELFSR